MRSLGFRLLAGAALFVTIALILVWFALTRLFESHVMAQYQRELVSVIDTLAANLDKNDKGLVLKTQPADPRYTIPAGGRYWQAWLEGAPVLRSRSLWDTEFKYSEEPEAYGHIVTIEGPSGAPLLALSQKLNIEGDKGSFDVVVTAAADKWEVDASLANFSRSLFMMLALTAVLLLLAAGLQIHFGLRPLDDLRRAVARIRAGGAARIDESGPAEVRPLVLEINTLLLGERAAVERARARASDLAHGLKTPLTILSQISESLKSEKHDMVAEQIQEQVDMIRSRTDRQLALARVAASGLAAVEIEPMVDRLVAALRRMPSEREINWQTDMGEGLSAAADAGDFAEATGNVLDNARLHAKSRVKVKAAADGRRVRLSVEDDGEGISKKDQHRALERGQRLDEAQEGTGLGLAITADIMRAYGGLIRLDHSSIGGLRVIMEWPLAQPPD
jgi:signal transduction histidine kinase